MAVINGTIFNDNSTFNNGAFRPALTGINDPILLIDLNGDFSLVDQPDTINGFRGNDIIRALGTSDILNGGSGSDTLYGNGGGDQLYGGSGNDILDGGSGDDQLNGNAGADYMVGRAGNDILTGGADQDSLIGGSGADKFDFNSVNESSPGPLMDHILDFNGAQGDQIDFSTIDANLAISGDQAFVPAQLSYIAGVLTANVISGSDIQVLLVGAPALDLGVDVIA